MRSDSLWPPAHETLRDLHEAVLERARHPTLPAMSSGDSWPGRALYGAKLEEPCPDCGHPFIRHRGIGLKDDDGRTRPSDECLAFCRACDWFGMSRAACEGPVGQEILRRLRDLEAEEAAELERVVAERARRATARRQPGSS